MNRPLASEQVCPRYDFVLFDADNTLFDFDAAEQAALRASFAAWGYPFTAQTEAVYHAINRPLWEAYGRGEVTQAELTVARFRKLADELGGGHDPVQMNETYLTHLSSNGTLYPGAHALVRGLSAHCRVAIVTNGLAAVQTPRLSTGPLAPYLSGIFISETMGCRKPEPRFFDLVCQALHITDRTRAVVVGDTPETDILGGRNGGMDTIWYNPHHMQSDILPTWTVAALEEIPAIVCKGRGASTRPLLGSEMH